MSGSAPLWLPGFILGWVVVGSVWALGAMGSVNDDAFGLVFGAWAAACGSAVLSSVYVSRGQLGPAGPLLVASAVLMPTFAAIWINLIPAAVGAWVTWTARPNHAGR